MTQEFTLKLTRDEVLLVERGLVELPFKTVAAFLAKVNQQLAEQQKESYPAASTAATSSETSSSDS